MKFKKLVKFDIKNFSAYKSARSMCVQGNIWLNANESPINNKFSIINRNLNRYPESQPKNIILKYAEYSKINFENIFVSRGIDESIELFIKIFCKPNVDKIMYFPPTYDMYRVNAEIFEIKTIKVFTKNYNNFDYDAIKKNIKCLKLIYICRPNNPTGDIMPKKILINILNISFGKVLVIVDEAYIEFCYSESIVNLIEQYPNLIVLRTMSKAFGLAGIRCGFSIAHIEIIKILKKFISPYPISTLTSNFIENFLNSNFINFMKKTVSEVLKNKIWLYKKLQKIKFIKKVFESFANYILIECFSSKFVIKKMLSKGIVLRNQNNNLGLKNCVRISIGTKIECKKLVYELKRLSYKFKYK
ncbi:histidinol-phosphate transaminase [Buchnera aphidicola]|uniref:histidinol-phosphate transaminase n=1 Tax=Buchnera aphidicola TaxID=9 RepID=UPI0031B85BA1